MTLRPRDPLLLAARVVTLIGMSLAALVASVTFIATPAVVVMRDMILRELAANGDCAALSASTPFAIALILLLISAMATCAFLFQRHLLRIIDSVGQGDPFRPDNAIRLAAMGWLTLAIEALSAPVCAIGQWVAGQVQDATSEFGIDMSGVLLALILFVLARVFREGARMREDLEGTV
ncbi:DUF2975 domain-containing protein [Novosphingobium sp.]|uniref:DUF2975 domain-containing protein n=1 Tax=Novosphingobium sp. TaxID=1874826 RepID=UPI0038BDCEAD